MGQLMINALACETIKGKLKQRLTIKQKLSDSVVPSILPLLMFSGFFFPDW